MMSTCLKNKGGARSIKCHGSLTCFQQRSGTLSERVRLVQVLDGGVGLRHGG